MLEDNDSELVPISALEKYSVCPRQCALIFVEKIWVDNVHTMTGTLLHERVDKPGYANTADGGATALRALPLFSKRYGLSGKADVVEMEGGKPIPVEYKKGRRKQWDNDDIQLCAQALCLEEMFKTTVTKGYIYHATSKRRREVAIDEVLREKTLQTIESVRELIRTQAVPKAVLKPCCEGCSLHTICMPELGSVKDLAACRQLIWYD